MNPVRWTAWGLDAPTWAFIFWIVWFIGWESWAFTQPDAYIHTWTAHIRPIFHAAPITWMIGFILWLWFGIHIFLPGVEQLILRIANWRPLP